MLTKHKIELQIAYFSNFLFLAILEIGNLVTIE